MTPFERDLNAAGFTGTTAEFYEAVVNDFAVAYPGRTYEWLARQPSLGAEFCNHFRDRFRLPQLADRTIMGGLENGRKQRIRPSFSRN